MTAPSRWQPQPRTRATEPLEILRAIAGLLREEPKRYRQHNWMAPESQLCAFVPEAVPACGTICCIAGWTMVITRPLEQEALTDDTWRAAFAVNDSYSSTAAAKLGLSPRQADALFDGGAVDQYAWAHHLPSPRPGTPEYAELGIAHMDAFARREMGYTGPAL